MSVNLQKTSSLDHIRISEEHQFVCLNFNIAFAYFQNIWSLYVWGFASTKETIFTCFISLRNWNENGMRID